MSEITLQKSGKIIFIQEENRIENVLFKLVGNNCELTNWVYIKPILKLLLEEHKKIEVFYLKLIEKKLSESNDPQTFRKIEEEMIENSMLYATEYIPKYLKSIESLIKKEDIYEQWYAQEPESDIYEGFTFFFILPGLVINSDIPNTLKNNYIFKTNEKIIIELDDQKYTKILTKQNNLDFIRLPAITYETEHGTKNIEFDNTILKSNYNMHKYEIIIPFIGLLLEEEKEFSISNDIYSFAQNESEEEETIKEKEEITEEKEEITEEKIDQLSKNYSVNYVDEETSVEILTKKEESTELDDNLRSLILQQIKDNKKN